MLKRLTNPLDHAYVWFLSSHELDGLKVDGINLLILVPASLHISTKSQSSKMNHTKTTPTTPLLALLGPIPWARICLICEDLFECTPTEYYIDLQTAFIKLLTTVIYVARELTCCCTEELYDWSECWDFDNAKVLATKKKYHRYHLWKAIRSTLTFGLWSFFIGARPDATIRPQYSSTPSWYITRAVKGGRQLPTYANELLHNISRLIDSSTWEHKNSIIASSESCTLHPMILSNMKLPNRIDPFKYAPLATSVASPAAAGRLGVAIMCWNPVA